jgi:ubiquinone/menaquinone biosynthesis C-methylase UbiE
MTKDSAGTDRTLLTRHAYATDEKLKVRYQTHEKYTVPRIDFQSWVLDCIDWRGDEAVLDLGAGPGSYFSPVRMRTPNGRHFAGDLSFGMVKREQENEAASRINLSLLDAQQIPYRTASFDVVLANHMLYHVPDLDATLQEIRRVLKPDGLLVAATNSENNMPELSTLYRRASLLLTNFQHRQAEALSVDTQFSLENGSQILSKHFFAVARRDLPSALIFPEADPVIAYLESMRDLREPYLPENVAWEDFMEMMRQQVTRLIEHSGKLVVKKLAGVVVATDSGGFAAEYVRRLGAD